MTDERFTSSNPPAFAKSKNEAATGNLGHNLGIWLSSQTLAIGGCVVLLIIVGFVWFAVAKSDTPDGPLAEMKPIQRFASGVQPTWEDLVKHFEMAYPAMPADELKTIYEQGCAAALDREIKDFPERIAKTIDPDVLISRKSDGSGYLHGKVYNGTMGRKSIEKLKLSIKTAKWERNYQAEVRVPFNTSAQFSIYIGEKSLEVKSFRVLNESE